MVLGTGEIEAGKTVFHQKIEKDVERMKIAQPIKFIRVDTRGIIGLYFFLLMRDTLS